MLVQLIRCSVKPGGWPKREEVSRRVTGFHSPPFEQPTCDRSAAGA